MSIALTAPLHVFGFKSDVCQSIWHLDEQTILYPSGSHCVLYNIAQRSQKFIPSTPGAGEMTALAVSPNRRSVAVAEKGAKPTISVFDLHTLMRRKVISTIQCQSSSFICLCFSADSRYLVALGGPPDWMLFYWTWENAKLLAFTTASTQPDSAIYQVGFNPKDITQLCVTGEGSFKLLSYSEDKNLRPFGNHKFDFNMRYRCHCWISKDKVLLGTDNGKVLRFDVGEIKGKGTIVATVNGNEPNALEVIPENGSNQTLDATSIHCITSFSQGFIFSAGFGTVHVFQASEEDEEYSKAIEIRIISDRNRVDISPSEMEIITSISLSPCEQSLVCGTNKNQMYTFPMLLERMGTDECGYFRLLSQSFHNQHITGLDVCIRKPLVATCGLDRSVRIWNFNSNSLEVEKTFTEEAYSVALHPSGFYVLVGFRDNLRLMTILMDDIRTTKEFNVRACRECTFSAGGHLFSAVQGTVIQLFSTTTFENVGNLKGHNGKIRCVKWADGDSKIISCGMDGAIYEWNAYAFKRTGESILKSCQYSCMTVSPDNTTVYAVGSDKTIKEVSDLQVVLEVATNETLTQVVLSKSGRMLFAGTSVGTILAFSFPLAEPGEWDEYVAHRGPVTKMRISPDDQYLFTVSEDACFFVHKISDRDGRGKHQQLMYSKEILICRDELEEKNSLMVELKDRMEELEMESQYQLRLKDMKFNEEVKEKTERYNEETEAWKIKNQVLKAEKDREYGWQQGIVGKLLQQHVNELEYIENVNNRKLMIEYDKFQKLHSKTQSIQENYEKQMQEKESKKDYAIKELTEFYEGKLRRQNTRLKVAGEDSAYHAREYEEMKRQIEEDGDREIVNLKKSYAKKLEGEKYESLSLRSERGVMNTKFTGFQKDIEDHKRRIVRKAASNEKLQTIIKNLESDIFGLKKNIQERDDTIQEKERRIYELKKKNQELEKFKFVLDHKIKELKKQIEPRENEIKELKENILQREDKLGEIHKENIVLDDGIDELVSLLEATNKDLSQEKNKLRKKEVVIKRFKNDLNNALEFIQDPKQLKKSIQDLYVKYVSVEDIAVAEKAGLDVDTRKEIERQRDYLLQTVSSLRKQATKGSDGHRKRRARVVMENVTLINEINDLRSELKMSRIQEHELESSVKIIKRRKERTVFSLIDWRDDFESTDIEGQKLLEIQKQQLNRLRAQIAELETKLTVRPPSVRLPSLDASG